MSMIRIQLPTETSTTFVDLADNTVRRHIITHVQVNGAHTDVSKTKCKTYYLLESSTHTTIPYSGFELNLKQELR